MIFKHTGLTCRTEENADRFYQQILGLEKQEPKVLPADISRGLFRIEEEIRIINYIGTVVHLSLIHI